MKILINKTSPGLEKKWNNFLKDHPNNTVFQSPVMYDFCKKVQNFEPFLFYAQDESGRCKGILLAVIIREGRRLKGYLSSRVVIYGGPLVSPDDNNVLNLLLESLNQKLKYKSLFIQFRNFFEWTDDEKAVFSKYGYQFKDRINLLVKTDSISEVKRNMQSGKTRQVMKSLSSGVTVSQPSSLADVQYLYQLLKNLYRNKVKKPLPSISFFENFYHMSKAGHLGIMRIIKLNGEIIGGIVAPVTNGEVIYEWYVVGLDKEYPKSYPSVLATWIPIQYALDNNLKQFDFMGLGKKNIPYGVRDFKLGFGNGIVNYGRFGRRNKLVYPIVEFAYNFLRVIKKI